MTTTLTPLSRNATIPTAMTRQTGPGVSVGVPIGLLLMLTYAANMGATSLTAATQNAVTLTAQARH